MKELKKYRFPLNLQLFNDDEEIQFEIEDDEEGIELEEFEDEGDEVQDSDEYQGSEGDEYEESDSEDQEPKREVKEKNEIAAAVIAERRKWQEKNKQLEKEAQLVRRLMQQMGIQNVDELNRQMDLLESQRLQQMGIPADQAERIARTERELKEQKQQLMQQKYAIEAERLKSDPLYSDLDDHYDELIEMAERNGITLKSAYLAVHGERRMKEREAELEAKIKANQQKRAAKKVDTSPTGTSSKKSVRVKLTPEEIQIAKLAGMKPEEYAKFKK